MFEECIHILADGRKCRRIPKRGQKLCPAHDPRRRRRAPLEENEDFHRQMASFVERLNVMPLTKLLEETTGLVTEIYLLIERRASRRDRLTFTRANTALSIAGDRLEELLRPLAQNISPQPVPGAQAPSTARPSQPLSPEAMATIQHAEAILNSGRMIPAEELDQLISEVDSY